MLLLADDNQISRRNGRWFAVSPYLRARVPPVSSIPCLFPVILPSFLYLPFSPFFFFSFSLPFSPFLYSFLSLPFSFFSLFPFSLTLFLFPSSFSLPFFSLSFSPSLFLQSRVGVTHKERRRPILDEVMVSLIGAFIPLLRRYVALLGFRCCCFLPQLMVIVVAGAFTARLRENRYVGGKVEIREKWGRKYLSVDIC